MSDEKNISPEVPNNVLVLTAGVDVGELSIHADVTGWAKGRESYGIRYMILSGDPHEREVWDRLDQELFERLFTTGDGKKMQVKKICVDAGYASDHVYAYTKKREPRVVATKGYGGMRYPLIKK
jgi:phage terminase large subunit GpA-like protein